jgi:cation:H+ antiporter
MSISGLIVFVAGLIALMVGAEMVVRGASRLAALLGVSPLVLGLTVVSIGTSIPELAVGITASLQGNGSLAVGNIAGTNMVNILFILGLSALLRPLPIHLHVLKLDLPMMVIASALLIGLAWDGVLTCLDGGLLFGAAVLYTIALLCISQRESQSVENAFEEMCGVDPAETCGIDAAMRGQRGTRARSKYAVMLIAGMGVTVVGADWMVNGAIDIARALDISDAVIGLTIVAIGTSFPELATTIVATIRNERDVAVGNLLGSSVYNILVILGIICMVSPGGLPVDTQLLLFDIPMMTGVALACVPVFLTGKRISRAEGGLGVAIYLTYMLWLILFRA